MQYINLRPYLHGDDRAISVPVVVRDNLKNAAADPFKGLCAPWHAAILHELQFVEFLLGLETPVGLRDAARFLDQCLLPWVPEMGARMAARADTQLYAATGMITAELLLALRAKLAAITGEAPQPRPLSPTVAAKTGQAQTEGPYMPGLGESW